MDNLCENCHAKMLPAALVCQYCDTVKRSPSTPTSAYFFAVGIGVAVLIIAYTPVVASALLPTTENYVAAEAILFIIALFGFIPICYYWVGRFLGFRWPETSNWTRSLCVMAPLGIVFLFAGSLPGLLFILPGYFGARNGKKRRAKM